MTFKEFMQAGNPAVEAEVRKAEDSVFAKAEAVVEKMTYGYSRKHGAAYKPHAEFRANDPCDPDEMLRLVLKADADLYGKEIALVKTWDGFRVIAKESHGLHCTVWTEVGYVEELG